jgi:hypothetical protein
MTTIHGLHEDTWAAMITGLALKRYQLLLGAGVSRDVADRKGNRLPSGDGMAIEIADVFGLDVSPTERKDLSRLFRSAGRRATKSGKTRDEWLTERFSKTSPPAWYQVLGGVSWRTIWTLNIDDAVERALRERVRAVHFAETDMGIPDGVIPVVHLHGDARDPNRGFVFSVDEYKSYVDTAKSWPTKFQETLSDDPFIIMGAALHHEFDLTTALNARARAVARQEPTIAVMPNPTALDREDFAEWNIEIFDGTAEQFLNRVRDDLPAAVNSLATTNGAVSPAAPALVRFLEHWHPTLQGKKTRWHDYLAGDEPEPSDVSNGLIVPRALEPEIIKDLANGKPVLMWGRPFSGKTSIALSVASKMSSQGYTFFSFQEESRLDIGAVLVRVRELPQTVLVIEYAGEFVRSLEELLERAREEGLPLRLLAIEREGPSERLKALGVFEEHEVHGHLGDDELESLVELLRRKGQLVAKWKHPSSTSISNLRKAKVNDLTGVLIELVLGEALESRVKNDYRAINTASGRAIAILGAIGSRVGGGISLGIAAAALGTTARAIESRLQDDNVAYSMAQIRGGRIRLRNRLFGELLTEKILSQKEAYGLVVGLCRALAPQLSRQAISDNTWAYRMARHLLDHDQLSKLIGRPRLDDFYSEIEDGFEWNSRFWEQRALAASFDRQHPAAERFANNGVEANRDGYSLTTLATVKFRKLAHSHPGLGEPEVDDEMWVALHLLREARDKSVHFSEHPFITFFSNMQTYAERVKQRGGSLSSDVVREWNEWWRIASQYPSFQTHRRGADLQLIQKKWLMAASA